MGRPRRHAKVAVPDYAEGLQIKTEDPDPRFNNALARGLAILRAFHLDRQRLGNLDLARITGLAKPTVSRLTYTLTQLGYLRYREEIGQYELAAGVVGLAYPYLVHQAVPPVARPLMLELARDSGTNVGLGVRDELSVLYLEYALGEPNPNRLKRHGFRIPLVRTATGRACIAGLHPAARERLFEHLRTVYKREWPQLQAELTDAVAQVEARGYVVAAGTFNPSTHAVAVPFVAPSSAGEEVLAFNCQGHALRHTARAMARNGKRLLQLTQTLRQRLAQPEQAVSLGR